jgi:hypothetical protein
MKQNFHYNFSSTEHILQKNLEEQSNDVYYAPLHHVASVSKFFSAKIYSGSF